jgi:ABC-type multidrug transport system fused ATPase/permease subunit
MLVQKKPLENLLSIIGVFVAGAFRMIPSVNRVLSSLQVIRYSRPAISLLHNEFALIKEITEDKNLPEAKHKIKFLEHIEIENVSFSYPNVEQPALQNLSIKIKKGECIGFIGASGSGKSTLIDIILGLLKPSTGVVKVDGVDINKNLRNWQNQIGYVPQTIYLTDDTLKSNIAFGVPTNEIDIDRVWMTIADAQLEDFVYQQSEKLDMVVGERGVRMSGGQRQRIGVARALYGNPSLLVLDEATSALDGSTESSVMEAINRLHGQKTILIVAHRLSTVKNCDRLFEMNKGVIKEVDINLYINS